MTNWKFNEDSPIFKQLSNQILLKIINGEYKKNEKIPSVRELSLETKTNPNTIVKALNELEDMGIIYTERTNGKFVTKDSKVIEKVKKDYIKMKVSQVLLDFHDLNMDADDLIEIIKEMKREI